VRRRDHVRITRLSPRRFISSTFSIRCVSTNGPFLIDLAMPLESFLCSRAYDPRRFPRPYDPRRLPRPYDPRRLPRRRTMSLSDGLGLRVRPSFLPPGLVGSRPPLASPS